jgi:hypothetical protein
LSQKTSFRAYSGASSHTEEAAMRSQSARLQAPKEEPTVSRNQPRRPGLVYAQEAVLLVPLSGPRFTPEGLVAEEHRYYDVWSVLDQLGL